MARTRTLTASGRYQEDGNDSYKSFGKRNFFSATIFGNTATINCGIVSTGFEEDLTYNGGTWGDPGSTKRWRAWIESYSDRQYTSWATGVVGAIRDTQRFYSAYYIYTYPNGPTAAPAPIGAAGLTQEAHVDWTASMTLVEHWEDDVTSPVGQRAPVGNKPWEFCTSTTFSPVFSCTQSGAFYFYDDTGTVQSVALAYSFSLSPVFTATPNRYFNTYSAAVSAQAQGATTLSWTATASGSGIEWPSGDSSTQTGFSGGTGTIGGTPLSGSLQNTGTGYSTCSITYSPNRCTGGTAQLNRYQDAGGISGVALKWTFGGADPGQTVSTDGSGTAGGFVYPYDGSKLVYKSTILNGVTVVSSSPSVPAHSMLIDPTSADSNGLFLMTGALGGTNGAMQAKVYKEFSVGTWQQDDSHAFDQFSSLAHWGALSGSGAFSLDLGGIKLAPSSVPYAIKTDDTIKRLNCWAYRYYTVTVRSDVAGAQIKIGIGNRQGAAAVSYAYWTITVTAANTWEDHEIDLALPESDSAGTSPLNYINHPATYFASKGSMSLTALTSGVNVWVKAFTGFLKQTGSRIPTLLLHDLNSNSRDSLGAANDQGRQFRGTSFASTSDTMETVPNTVTGGNYSRTGAPQGTQWGRLIVNGVVGADIRTAPAGDLRNGLLFANPGYTSSTANFWKNLKTLADNAANDTGVHITEAGSSGEFGDSYTSDWKRTELWTRLNDTAGSPVTLSVACEPSGITVTPANTYPGCGDYYNGGSYGVRLVTHYHDWRGGEMMGVLAGGTVRRPISGRSISIVRHPSGSSVGSASSNADGFWRAFVPYGVPRPYSNNPSGAGTSGSPHFLAQFTGTAASPTGYPNTSPGNNFAPFILASTAFNSRDGSNYAVRPDSTSWAGTTKELFGCWDRYGTFYGFGDAIPPSAVGLDLARNPWNWLYRSYRKDSPLSVQVGRLILGGSWSDVSVATDLGTDAIPTLLVDRRGTVLVFYHDGSSHSRLWWSTDTGATWSDRGTLSGLGTFPRACLLPDDRLLVVSFVSGGLAVHRSSDWQTASPPTFSLVATFASLPEQLADIHCDRSSFVHLVSMDGTNVNHAYSRDGATWSTPTVLASGDHAAYALGIERGVLARWSGTTPHVELTDEAYGSVSGTPFDLTGFAPDTQYLGAVWDAGETLIIGALDGSGVPVIYYSPDRHTLAGL